MELLIDAVTSAGIILAVIAVGAIIGMLVTRDVEDELNDKMDDSDRFWEEWARMHPTD